MSLPLAISSLPSSTYVHCTVFSCTWLPRTAPATFVISTTESTGPVIKSWIRPRASSNGSVSVSCLDIDPLPRRPGRLHGSFLHNDHGAAIPLENFFNLLQRGTAAAE